MDSIHIEPSSPSLLSYPHLSLPTRPFLFPFLPRLSGAKRRSPNYIKGIRGSERLN